MELKPGFTFTHEPSGVPPIPNRIASKIGYIPSINEGEKQVVIEQPYQELPLAFKMVTLNNAVND
jgi:hypothetical protein